MLCIMLMFLAFLNKLTHVVHAMHLISFSKLTLLVDKQADTQPHPSITLFSDVV